MAWHSQLQRRSLADEHCVKQPVCTFWAAEHQDAGRQHRSDLTKLLRTYLSFTSGVDLKRYFIFGLNYGLCEQIGISGEITEIAR